MTFRPTVREFARALVHPFTYDLCRNWYIFFGALWGATFPLIVFLFHLYDDHAPPLATDDFGFLAFPAVFAVVFGTLGTVRREKEELVNRTIAALDGEVAARTRDLRDAYVETVLALSQAIEAKDPYTRGHSYRVWEYAERAARKLGVDAADLEDLRFACFLHDVGKIKIPGRILNKAGPLTEDERAIIALHPIYSERIIQPISKFHRVAELVRQHHERDDGTGYPDRLAGDELSVLAKIIIVADAMDAMTSTRPYRRALAPAVALEELRRCSGLPFDAARLPSPERAGCLQFDPRVVFALAQALEEEPLPAVVEPALSAEDSAIASWLGEGSGPVVRPAH